MNDDALSADEADRLALDELVHVLKNGVKALPTLLRQARRGAALDSGIQALAEELESFTVNRNPAPGSYDAGVVATFVNVAARLRDLVDGGEQR